MAHPVIAVDAMGSDHGPAVVVRGAAEASRTTGAHIRLVGDPTAIARVLDAVSHDPDRISVEAAAGTIPMDADPQAALKAAPDASLPTAARLASQQGGADALVTAGHTGAAILACAAAFRRIPGVRRTALAAVIPTEQRHGPKQDPFALLLDAGATVRVESDDLVSFALMGAAYARVVSANPVPKVALLSNGTEPLKGTPEGVEAHRRLVHANGIDFIGNIEGVDIPRGTADVIVTDGFTGNITLKMLEGISETVLDLARAAHRSRLTWRLGLWLLQGGIRRLKEVTDWKQYGGAPILGFDRLCIKAHGRSNPTAIRNAIRVAERCVAQQLTERISESLSQTRGMEPAG
jgi:glycerol-3-phosphate acyltransferase PlsX